MTYTHLTPNELVLIEAYFQEKMPVSIIASHLKRARQTIYHVINFLKEGHSALNYWEQYKKNKKLCGRHSIVLPENQQDYVRTMVAQGWTPDVIIGRAEFPIDCSMRTLYRQFKRGQFDCASLPMKGKRKPNGYSEKRGKQAFKRHISERNLDYPNFNQEFGHLEGDTIVGIHHKSAIITLVERLSKVIITLKPEGRKASDIEKSLNDWLEAIPQHFFKSITFDCGKEFSNWKSVCHDNDLSIYFADPGTPSQRGLNEHSNGLLRRNGLPKNMDFTQVDQAFVSSISLKRNLIPRKSLNYQTPMEILMSHVHQTDLSSLI